MGASFLLHMKVQLLHSSPPTRYPSCLGLQRASGDGAPGCDRRAEGETICLSNARYLWTPFQPRISAMIRWVEMSE
jgi:hypothetical protein